MRLFGLEIGRSRPNPAETRSMTINQSASPEEVLAFLGLSPNDLPPVTLDSAMKVPAFAAAVLFLSRTLATLPLVVNRTTREGPVPVGGRLQTIVRDAPNGEWSSFGARVYFWQQVFTVGRGMLAIIRDERGQPYELWPLNAHWTRVTLQPDGRRTYTVAVAGPQPIAKTYASSDVIDVPFLLAPNTITAMGPLELGRKAIQLAAAMNDYGAAFFAGGGVPPLALEGPLPTGAEGMRRAMDEVSRVIGAARASDKPVFPMPPGHKLTQVGFDPAKGQMTEARLFQIQEIGRLFQLPPVFLGDLSKATFTNTEQQDLQLVKHLVGQWAKAFEDEANLKLFGQMNALRTVRHDLDSLLRGDLLSRMTAMAQSVQNAILTPDEVRAREGLPPMPGGDQLFIQGATVPIADSGQNKQGAQP